MIEGNVYRFIAPDVKVLNTVGSGDSTIAGMAVGLSLGMSERDTVKLGMACGITNTQFSETGRVIPEMVKSFYEQVIVEKI
ncbi:MAG: hypothetical protein HFH14_08130 [Lachnospiraceae bacterium]|nr:hypothetical protein [Lachnospiraceae bacterium]